MSYWIDQLTEKLLKHVETQGCDPLGHIGVFHSHSEQRLHQVPIHYPSLVFVLKGRKQIIWGDQEVTGDSGEVLLIPGNTSIYLSNLPDRSEQVYLALVLAMTPSLIEGIKGQITPDGSDNKSRSPLSNIEKLTISPLLGLGLQQWMELCISQVAPTPIHNLRAMELILCLCQDGLFGNVYLPTIFSDRNISWKQRVVQLIQSDVTRAWSLADVCLALATSESSLRRNLLEEDTGFRELLEEVRLVSALSVLQETHWSIGRVASEVGYAHQGHFSDRFKKRFGISPKELKLTRTISASASNRQAV